MEELKALIKSKNLSKNELFEIIKFCNSISSFGYYLDSIESCIECGNVDHSDCIKLTVNRSPLCDDCVRHCGPCDVYYGKNEKMKHNNCYLSD